MGQSYEWHTPRKRIRTTSLIFVCFINDMPSEVASPVHLFADDTKLYRRITTLEDHKALQDDLTNLEDWSTKWNLCFNSNKCKVMHIGHSNPQHEYVMYSGGPPIMLDTTTNEKDLGVHVDANLTFEHHVEDVVNKANRMLGMIRRAYTFLDGPTLTKLYTSLIRPLLEYIAMLHGHRCLNEISFSWRMSKDVQLSWFQV